MKAWGITDIGCVREVNQDAYRLLLSEESGVFLVCDGMGGAKAGEVASALAAEAFMKAVYPLSEHFSESAIREIFSSVNQLVFEEANANPEHEGMGTTMVCALCCKGQTLIANVGDSRAYLLDQNGMRQVTEDHSLVTELVKRGELTEYQANRHPSRNVITRAVGAEPAVQCDVFSEKPEPGQYLLLCSDGLFREVTDPEIYYEVYQSGQPETACERLLTMAKNRGGRDNITILLIAY